MARAAPLETIPIERIRPGMKGYGLSVFSGFKIERFNVEVIDVLRNFLPSQDLFLIRADHPVLRHTGVVGGMSGSPIYLEGKLAGALAYGWRFTKDPICGITPIKNMLELLQRKPRGIGPWNTQLPAGQASAGARRPADRAALAALSRVERWWKNPLARPGSAAPPPPTTTMIPVAMPLNVAGFPAVALPELQRAFAAFGFEPVQGGGSGTSEGPARLEAGGAVAVQLVSGQMSMAGTGTVTSLHGNRALAFGHRMFNAGEIYVSATTARINHTLANVSRSFKLATPGRVIGSLVQDRQAGIMVDSSIRVGTVPLTITTRAQGEKRVFKAAIARHRLLTGTLTSNVLMGALGESVADVDQASFKITTRFALKGYKPVQLEDHLFSPGGISLTAAVFSRGIRALREVLSTDFEPVFVERIDIDLDVTFGNDVVEITAISLSSSTVEAGARINVRVTFRPYGGHEFTKSYPLDIPRTMAGSLLSIEASSGPLAPPDRASPENMKQLLESLQEGYPARSLVLGLALPQEGLKLRGQVIRDLPGSIIDTLIPATTVRGEQTFQTVLRKVHGTQRLIVGKKSIRIRVREAR